MNAQPIIFETLATLMLTMHLASVNVSSAAPLLAVLLDWQARGPQREGLQREARRLAMLSMAMLLAGALAGLLLAGIMWFQGDRGLFAVLPRFGVRIHWALWELAFYLLCLAGYVALFARRFAGRGWVRPLRTLLAVLASANLLYHFPPLFAVMARAADAPETVSAQIGPSEFRGLMYRAPIISLTVHFALASFAVAGVVLMQRITRAQDAVKDATVRARALRTGAIVALAATGLQLLVGLWVLISLPPLTQRNLMGGDAVGTAGLALSVTLSFWLLHLLAHACVTQTTTGQVRGTLLLLLLIVLLMTATLRRAEASGGPSPNPSPQAGRGNTDTPPRKRGVEHTDNPSPRSEAQRGGARGGGGGGENPYCGLASPSDVPLSSTTRTMLSWPPKATDLPSRFVLTT